MFGCLEIKGVLRRMGFAGWSLDEVAGPGEVDPFRGHVFLYSTFAT